RGMRISEHLGARRFKANLLEFSGRILLAQGQRAEAVQPLREGLAICHEVGLQFVGPRIISALALATDEPAKRHRLLEEGEALLRLGALGHNHLWFYRDGMEALLEVGDTEGATRYASALETYTQPEPLPWSDLFIARARALAAMAQGGRDDALRQNLEFLGKTLDQTGM